MKPIILTVTLCIYLAFSGTAQIAFYKIFSDQGVDRGQGIVQLPDSSYVITGSSSSFSSNSSQAFLLKLDSTGTQLWSNNYGGPESESGRRVLYVDGSGFYICGFTNSIGSGGFDFYLAKTDENGTLEWESAYGNTGWERVNDAALTQDTGVIMIGTTSSTAAGDEDLYIVRTNAVGDTLWTKTIGGVGNDNGTSIAKYTDSTFIIGGTVYNSDSLLSKGFMAHLQDDGTLLWEAQYGYNGNYAINDVCVRQAQIVAVGSVSPTIEDMDDCAFYSDFSGNQTNEKQYVSTSGNEQMDLCINILDSTKALVVRSYDNTWSYPGGTDLKFSRFSVPFSNSQLNFIVYHDNPDVSGEIIETSDGGLAFTGYSTGFISGGNEILVIKIGPNDSLPADATQSESFIGLPIIDDYSNVQIYPNPSANSIHIVDDEGIYETLRIFNAIGELLIEKKLSHTIVQNVEDLKNGVYFIQFSGSNAPTIQKQLIIQH